jgi:murein DD-endopeptidase MepM/ murein hydrolase activator NlpD
MNGREGKASSPQHSPPEEERGIVAPRFEPLRLGGRRCPPLPRSEESVRERFPRRYSRIALLNNRSGDPPLLLCKRGLGRGGPSFIALGFAERRPVGSSRPLVQSQQRWKTIYGLALVVWWAFSGYCAPAPPLPHDRNVQIFEQRQVNGTILIAHLTNCTEATITVTMNLVNMAASTTLPLTVDAKGRSRFELLRIQAIDPRQTFRYQYEYKWRPGRRSGMATSSFIYQLPYVDESHRVVQGPLGSFSHQAGSGSENAIDFGMPAGSKVCAARDGTVVALWQDSDIGGADPTNRPYANYVVVAHEDGTFAEYYHLKKNGVLVGLGQKVKTRDTIALSGNTGYSSRPHLHFGVFSNLDATNRITIPVQFTTKSGTIESLRQGHTY